MKICSKCGKCKSSSEYYVRKQNADGLQGKCKACCSEYAKELSKTSGRKITLAWNHIKQRANNASEEHPTYVNVELRLTREEFVSWMSVELVEWSKHSSISAATVDRIESDGHYEIGNLRLATRAEQTANRKASRNVHAPTGTAWCNSCCQFLSVNRFGSNKNHHHQLAYKCKKCNAEHQRKYRKQKDLQHS